MLFFKLKGSNICARRQCLNYFGLTFKLEVNAHIEQFSHLNLKKSMTSILKGNLDGDKKQKLHRQMSIVK